MIFGGYEAFKYQNSLISAVYPTAPEANADVASGSSLAKHQLMQTVAQRGKYWYTYSEYLWASLLSSWCCCMFKNRKCSKRLIRRLQRHSEAYDKLVEEVDIVKLLYVQRIGQFMAKLLLKKHQRALVTNFSKFKVSQLDKDGNKTTQESKNVTDTGEELLGVQREDGVLSDMAIFQNDQELTEE